MTETSYVPMCPGNGPENGFAVCGAALAGCPNPGEVRHWVYSRQVDAGSGAPVSPWRRVSPPPFVCLGADDPRVDPTVAVVATVRSEFKDFPLEQGLVRTRPIGESLVNALTELSTTTDGRDSVSRTILGLPVVVQAVATSYTWRFGDGTSLTVAAQGGPPAVQRHTYTRPGPVAVGLDIVYTGTFTVGGSATVYDVDGTATIVGPPTGLVLREARTQLQADSS